MTKRATTKRKKSKLLSRWTRNKKLALLFAAIFAVIGGYYIIRSFASTLPIPTGEKVIMERRNTIDQPADGARLQDAETISFRVYESGLAVCGGYTDKSHPEQYYSSQLTTSEINSLVNSVKQTGFFNLERTIGNGGNVVSTKFQTISILRDNVGKVVIADPYYTPKPKAYVKTNTIIDSFCSKLTAPYVPESIEITSKVVANNLTNDGKELSASSSVDNTTSALKVKKISGAEARTLHKLLGRKGKNILRKQGKNIEIRADNVLPPEMSIQDNTRPPKKSFKLPSFGSILPSAKASAAVLPVKYYILCATDNCGIGYDLNGYIANTKELYKRNINQSFSAANIGIYRGKHNVAYYRTCHGRYLGATCGGNDPVTNILTNITYEMFGAGGRGWAPDSPRIFMLGFNARETQNTCGVAFIGEKGYMTGVVSTTPAIGGSCAGNWYEFDTAAHELGHIFGLDHVTDGTLMHPSACNGVPVFACRLNGMQGIYLTLSSKFLN